MSGWGWSLGYVGGLVSLGASLAYVTWAQAHGQGAAEFVPVTMLITAAIFALASLPTLLMLRERAVPQPGTRLRAAPGEQVARHPAAISNACPTCKRFLICTVLYQAGIQAVITLAAIYASQVLDFSTRQTILLVLLVNITAALGAFVFGHVQDRIGHVRGDRADPGRLDRRWCCWPGRRRTERMFWVAANLAGLCMGAVAVGGARAGRATWRRRRGRPSSSACGGWR